MMDDLSGGPNIKWLGFAAIIFFIIMLFRGSATRDTSKGINDIDDDLIDLHLAALNSKNGVSSLLKDNLGPAITVIPAEVTYAELVKLSDMITSKWSHRIEAIASNMSAPVHAISLGIAKMMAIPNAEVRENALSYYLALTEIWSKMFVSTATTVAATVKELAIQANVAVASSNMCILSVITQDVRDTSIMSKDTIAKTTVTTSNGNMLLGLMGKMDSTTEWIDTYIQETEVQSRDIVYVPTCLQQSLDVTKLDAIMGLQAMSLTIVYSMLRDVIKMLPNPENFVS